MAHFNPLRPITQRLNSTSIEELPRIAPFLALSLLDCSEALQSGSAHREVNGHEDALMVHKLKTKISSLLQDRSPNARFAAVVLIKAVVEAGDQSILAGTEPWIRGLISSLGKPLPVATKRLCLATIVRIFVLTQEFPSLLREITTPWLSTFLASCTELAKPKTSSSQEGLDSPLSPLLEPVLRSFLELLPSHPTIFRPFLSRISIICLSLIGDSRVPVTILDVAGKLVASLHYCGPKNSAGAEWTQSVKSLLTSCHRTADHLFRAVIEEWEPSDEAGAYVPSHVEFTGELKDEGPDAFGFTKWTGIRSGSQRLMASLEVLKHFLGFRSAQSVPISVGLVVDLTARLTSVRSLSNRKNHQFSVQNNVEIGRDERDTLWMELPSIHVAVLDLLSTLVQTLSDATLPVGQDTFALVLKVFNAERRSDRIRRATYELLERLFPLLTFSLTRAEVKLLDSLTKTLCTDLLRSQGSTKKIGQIAAGTHRSNEATSKSTIAIDVDGFLQRSVPGHRRQSEYEESRVYAAASRLLPGLLETISADCIPSTMRTDLDRTAILVQHEGAMLASVLNPPPRSQGRVIVPSIMPFLARSASEQSSVEHLLRPRMPVIWSNGTDFDEEETFSTSEESVEDMAGNPNGPAAGGLGLLERLEESLHYDTIADNERKAGSQPQPLASSIIGITSEPMLGVNGDGAQKRDFASFKAEAANLNEVRSSTTSSAEGHRSDPNKKRRVDEARTIHSASVNDPTDIPGVDEGGDPTKDAPEISWTGTRTWLAEGVDELKASHTKSETQIRDSRHPEEDESDFEIPEIIVGSDTDMSDNESNGDANEPGSNEPV